MGNTHSVGHGARTDLYEMGMNKRTIVAGLENVVKGEPMAKKTRPEDAPNEQLWALLEPVSKQVEKPQPELIDEPDAPADPWLPRSYTLRLNGRIEDRRSGEILEDVNPDAAKSVAEKLLQVIPRGGRLRVTASGGVARYQDEQWEVVEKVSKSEWFPDHLT